jgi:hypothetical protein
MFALAGLFCVSPIFGNSSTLIRGELLDQAGAVIVSATVQLLALDRVRETRTDERGQFTIANIPQEPYILVVCHLGFKPRKIEQPPTASDAGQQITITLEVDGMICGFTEPSISYEKRVSEVSLVGSVTNWDGRRLDAASVTLRRTDGDAAIVQTSKANGEFEFVGLEPGKYLLEVSRDGYFDQKGMSVWIARENLTKLSPVSLWKKGDKRLIICQ